LEGEVVNSYFLVGVPNFLPKKPKAEANLGLSWQGTLLTKGLLGNWGLGYFFPKFFL